LGKIRWKKGGVYMVSKINSHNLVSSRSILKKTCVLGVILVFGVTFLTFLCLKTQVVLGETNYIVERYEYSCFNSSILTVEINSTNGSTWDYFGYNISCPNGCEENLNKYGADCIEPAYIITLEVIIGIIFLIIFVVWVGRRK